MQKEQLDSVPVNMQQEIRWISTKKFDLLHLLSDLMNFTHGGKRRSMSLGSMAGYGSAVRRVAALGFSGVRRKPVGLGSMVGSGSMVRRLAALGFSGARRRPMGLGSTTGYGSAVRRVPALGFSGARRRPVGIRSTAGGGSTVRRVPALEGRGQATWDFRDFSPLAARAGG
jgi:hypothetical protein